MEVIPQLEATRFEQLAAGDLFLYINGNQNFYALKTAPLKALDGNGMVTLGPTFADGFDESSIMLWQSATTLKIGRNYSILFESATKNSLRLRPTSSTNIPTCSFGSAVRTR